MTLFSEEGVQMKRYNTYDTTQVFFSNRTISLRVPDEIPWSGCYYFFMDEGRPTSVLVLSFVLHA
jgi:hypothetical protein